MARRGEIAWCSPLGLMDRERGKPMRADTLFRIYSMTKPITSVAMMTLLERGAFSLSDPVHRYIPAWQHLQVYRNLPDGCDLASLAPPGAFSETRYDGVGFGLGGYVVVDPVRSQLPSSIGEFGWGGTASTAFWIDHADDMVVVFLTQLVPSSTFDFRGQLKAIIRGAIIG